MVGGWCILFLSVGAIGSVLSGLGQSSSVEAWWLSSSCISSLISWCHLSILSSLVCCMIVTGLQEILLCSDVLLDKLDVMLGSLCGLAIGKFHAIWPHTDRLLLFTLYRALRVLVKTYRSARILQSYNVSLQKLMAISTFFIDDDINLFLFWTFRIQDGIRNKSVFFVPLSLTWKVILKFLSLVVFMDDRAYSYTVSTVCNFSTLLNLSLEWSWITTTNGITLIASTILAEGFPRSQISCVGDERNQTRWLRKS